MKWLRRTDHARRTKGDPPPTYQELEATVAELARKLADAVAANTALHDRNERLHADLQRMRERLPGLADGEGICGSKAAPFASDEPPAICKLRYGHASDWHEDEGGMRWTYQLTPTDPDPSRPYIREYEAEEEK